MDKSKRAVFIIIVLLVLLLILILGLGNTFVPLMVSGIFSYLCFPLIKKIEAKGIKRHFALLSVFVFLLIIIGLLIALLLPGLIRETESFFRDFPSNFSLALAKIEDFLLGIGMRLDLGQDALMGYFQTYVSEFGTSLLKGTTQGLKASVSGIVKCLLLILNIFLIPIFFFYVINDYEKISGEIKSYIPKSMLSKFFELFRHSNRVLSGYIRGQLLVAFILSILYAIGLSLVGLKFGLFIGLFSGFISIIPYAGFILGMLTAMTMALASYSGVDGLFAILMVFSIVWALESFIITPRLVGDKVGLSSLAIILSLIIGGNLFGLLGMLLAIPVAGILKVIVKDLKEEYQSLEFYKE